MDVVALMVGLVIIMGVFLSLIAFRTIFSPLGIYSLVWGIIIFLFSLHQFVGFDYVDIRLEVWILIFLGWLVYTSACLTVAIIPRKKTNGYFNPSFLNPSFLITMNRWIRLFTIIGGFGIGIKWIILFYLFGGLSNIIGNLGNIRLQMLRGEFVFPWIIDFLVFFLFPALIFVSILATKYRSYFKWIIIITIALYMNDFALASRGTAMYGFLLAFSAYLLAGLGTSTETLLIKRSLYFVIGGVVLILILNLSRVVREGLMHLGLWTYIADTFHGLYLYATGPLPAFSQIFDIGTLSQYFGAYTFGGIYRLINVLTHAIGLGNVFPIPPKPYMMIPQPFNTYPHLWFFYSDFGFLGTLVIMWILGFLFSYTYLKYRTKKRLSLLVDNILLFTYLLYTPRDTMTFWVSFWFTFVVSWVIAKFVERSQYAIFWRSVKNHAHTS